MELKLENVSYTYNPGTAYEIKGVKNADLSFTKDTFYAIIGHTGSGKSTLLQLMNGLLKPTEGRVLLDGEDVHEKKYPIKKLRSRVGLVFQYPEYQLFEETILKDVCFGPKNLGCDKEEAEKRAKYSLSLVGITEDMYDQNPFNLSGGQKRRVAIAGVLAMKPDILILDEPTAGLDPEGREQILELMKNLCKEDDIGIVMVSHHMEDVASYAERTIVLHQGDILYNGPTAEVFSHAEELTRIGLDLPFPMRMRVLLKEKGIDIPVCLNNEQLANALANMAGGGRLC